MLIAGFQGLTPKSTNWSNIASDAFSAAAKKGDFPSKFGFERCALADFNIRTPSIKLCFTAKNTPVSPFASIWFAFSPFFSKNCSNSGKRAVTAMCNSGVSGLDLCNSWVNFALSCRRSCRTTEKFWAWIAFTILGSSGGSVIGEADHGLPLRLLINVLIESWAETNARWVFEGLAGLFLGEIVLFLADLLIPGSALIPIFANVYCRINPRWMFVLQRETTAQHYQGT